MNPSPTPVIADTVVAMRPEIIAALDTLTEVVTNLREAGIRPSREEYAVMGATILGSRADCTRRSVGALLFDAQWRIIGAGYNGAPAGHPGCLSEGACPRGRQGYDKVPRGAAYVGVEGSTCGALHAEENTFLYSDHMARRGGLLAVSDAPCPNCSRLLPGSGIARAVWREPGAATLTVRTF